MVKKLDVERLGGWNVLVPSWDEELVSSRRAEGVITLLDVDSTLPVPAP